MKFISPRTHSIIGTLVGVALLFAPTIFGFSDVGGAAVTLPMVMGAIVILAELTVRGSFTGMDLVAMKTHVMMDIAMGVVLAASPWLFDFANLDSSVWAPHVAVGIAMVAYAMMTQTERAAVRSR